MQTPQPYHEKRPWGEELWLTKGLATGPSMVKIISVEPGEALSLQYHRNRDEFWHVISGSGAAEISDARIELVSGGDYFVPRGEKHRLIGGASKLELIELAFGDFDESDIVRLEDRYGRTS